MFVVALFMVADTWKQPNCLATDEIICVYAIKYYLAIKRNADTAVTGISLHNSVEFTEVAIKGCMMTSLVENVPSRQS